MIRIVYLQFKDDSLRREATERIRLKWTDVQYLPSYEEISEAKALGKTFLLI